MASATSAVPRGPLRYRPQSLPVLRVAGCHQRPPPTEPESPVVCHLFFANHPETCVQTSYNFKRYCLQVPHSQQDWESIAASFDAKWQFPNCIGAMDGKHIALKAPAKSGSTFYDYKLFDSIVLMAVVDAHYGVIMFDVTVI